MKLRVAEEVEQGRAARKPLVALETSVVAQGLPYPYNLQAARACEEAVRRGGAVPAAIAVLDGEIRVGLATEELRRLAEAAEQGESLMKIGSRDLALAVSGLKSGGTTVSATCEISAAAGIRVFATGGIGGVHRGVAESLDVSQDIWALSRFPVAVVCAGAKSVLDLPKTMELLEAVAVPVIGVGSDELPSFFSRGSGIQLEQRVVGADEGARLMRARFDALEQGGMLFTVPPPAATSLPRAEVELQLAAAMKLADDEGIQGKQVTPFLLAELVKRTGGKTLQANLALLESNARFAAELAVAYSALS